MFFRFLIKLINLSVFVLFGFFAYVLYDRKALAYDILDYLKWEYIVIIMAIYAIIYIQALMSKMIKNNKNIIVNNATGQLEISIDTISNMTDTFLKSKEIIRNSKTKIERNSKTFDVYSEIECNQSDNINDILADIKNELSAYIYDMIGITPRKINLKINKINIVSTNVAKPVEVVEQESEIIE